MKTFTFSQNTERTRFVLNYDDGKLKHFEVFSNKFKAMNLRATLKRSGFVEKEL